MEMKVRVGKGYSLAELNKDEDAPTGTIPIDAVYSPIKRVNYNVGNARVGQRTDYDKLTMEVSSNQLLWILIIKAPDISIRQIHCVGFR